MTSFEIVYRCEEGDGSLRPAPRDAVAARTRLDEGNRTFAALFDRTGGPSQSVVPIDISLVKAASGVPKQRPFAAVLGCSDARVPIELVFNVGPNDIFVVRVAGNGLGADVLGSLKYAIDHLGTNLKLIVVLAHSGCGAVSAAVEVFLNPAEYLALATNRAARGILDQLIIVVHAAARRLMTTFGEGVTGRPGYRNALVEMSVATNAALTAYTIQRAIGEDGPNDLKTAFGVYLLESCRVWAPQTGSIEWDGLADAPADLEGFAKLADSVARSPRIAGILNS